MENVEALSEEQRIKKKRVITPDGQEMIFYGEGPWGVTLNEETGRCVAMGTFDTRANAERALADAENYLDGEESMWVN